MALWDWLALAFALVGVVVGVVAFLGDYALSDLVERSRPSTGSEVSVTQAATCLAERCYSGSWRSWPLNTVRIRKLQLL